MNSTWGKLLLLLIALLLVGSKPVLAADNAAKATAPSPAIVTLPAPDQAAAFPLAKALATRRSHRDLAENELSLQALGQLLWAAQGKTDEKGHRTAPSAMARYALETYVVAAKVKGLAPGLYKYASATHSLTLLRAGELRDGLVDQAIGQNWIKAAPAVLVLCGVAERMVGKNGESMAKFMYVEAGLAAQNFFLQVTALGLGSTYVGGFKPVELSRYLALPANEEAIAVLPVGTLKAN